MRERLGIMIIFFSVLAASAVASGLEYREALKNEDPEIRSDACLALIPEGKGAIGALAPLLEDKSLLVRHCAAYALNRIGGPAVEKLFRDNLRSANYDIRRISALGLGMGGEKDVLKALTPLLKDENWEVRWAAAYALGKSGDRRALAGLAPVAEGDPCYDRAGQKYPVREAAGEAMLKLNRSIGWQTSPEQAFSRARAEKKPLLLYFRASGSELCPEFEKRVLTEEKIIDALQRCRCLWLDHMVEPLLFERYRVKRVPTLIFFSGRGEERGRVEGVILPPELLGKILDLIEEEKSFHRLRARLRDNPRDREAAWQLAELYMDEGSWEKAAETLEPLIRNDPHNLSSLLDNALFARAYIRGEIGDYEGSRRDFQELLRRFPSFGNRSQALYCWGLSALKAGKISEGKKAFRRLTEQYPQTPTASAAQKILRKLGED